MNNKIRSCIVICYVCFLISPAYPQIVRTIETNFKATRKDTTTPPVVSITLSSDGKSLILAGCTEIHGEMGCLMSRVEIYSYPEMKLLRKRAFDGIFVIKADLSPDGKKIVLPTAEGIIKILDFETLEPLNELNIGCSPLPPQIPFAFSRDGKLFATTKCIMVEEVLPTQNMVVIYNENYDKIKEFVAAGDEIFSLIFTLDNMKLLSHSHDMDIKSWETETYELIKGVQVDFDGAAATMTKDGKFVLYVSRIGAQFYDLNDFSVVNEIKGKGYLSWSQPSNGGNKIAYVVCEMPKDAKDDDIPLFSCKSYVEVVDITSHKILNRFPVERDFERGWLSPWNFVFSPDDKSLLISGCGKGKWPSEGCKKAVIKEFKLE